MPLVIGLMSGTSVDGVTAVLARFSGRGVQVLRERTTPFSPALKKRLLIAPSLTAAELSRLNFELGRAFAQAAARIRGRERVQLIGSHGQTVWHGPTARPANTLQLGEASVISERTGLPVVSDFRVRDVAAGGQGAPLIPAFDEFLFARGPVRAVQNIGGIGNVSVVGGGKLWTAFDTGPGNGLLDLAVRLATGGRKEMDEDGRLAARGKVDEKRLAALLRHPFLRRRPPKSFDKGDFGPELLRRHFGAVSPSRLPDVLATLSAFTARSIADAYGRFWPRRISEVVVSGGGALNPVLMRRLREALGPVPVVTSERYGLPVMAKEAAGFAWLALRAWQGRTNNCPTATGAGGRRILGKITS